MCLLSSEAMGNLDIKQRDNLNIEWGFLSGVETKRVVKRWHEIFQLKSLKWVRGLEKKTIDRLIPYENIRKKDKKCGKYLLNRESTEEGGP